MMPNSGLPHETWASKGNDDKKKEIDRKQSTQESSSSSSRNVVHGSTRKTSRPAPFRMNDSVSRSFQFSFQNHITLEDIEKQNYMRHLLRLRDRLIRGIHDAADPTYEEEMERRKKLGISDDDYH